MLTASWLWWMARSTGLVAEVALLGATVCGVAIGGNVPGLPGRRAMALHEAWTLAAVIAVAGHAALIAVDVAARVQSVALVVPFASPVLRGPVALGTIALWGTGVVAASGVLRSKIPRDAWRALHAAAYATFALAVAHGLFAGTDARHPAVLGLHAVAVGMVVAASVWRATSPSPGRATTKPRADSPST